MHVQPVSDVLPTAQSSSPAVVSGRVASPADEPAKGETRGKADHRIQRRVPGPEDPTLDSGWHPDPADHPQRVAVTLTPREAPWRSDSAQDVSPWMTGGGGSTAVKPSRENGAVLRVAYLFSGVSRRSSIASELRKLCLKSGVGLTVDEIDIYNGGSSHDLLNPEVQAELERKIESGGYDVVIISPPCATWSRATFNHPPGGRPDSRYPEPCRSK